MLCRMATDHGVAARFYLLVIVFAVPASFALASSTLTNAAILARRTLERKGRTR